MSEGLKNLDRFLQNLLAPIQHLPPYAGIGIFF